MQAAVLEAVGQPLTLREVPRPVIGPDEALVQTRACGICGTDLHMQAGWGYQPALPFVMGHEPSGVVVEVGANVRRFSPGDRVVPNIFYACGECFYCRTNRETQCLQLGGILGVLEHWGGYGEFFKIPARQLFALPEAVSFAEGAVIADAVVTAVHAVQRGRVAAGERVAVLGVGGCGSAALQIAQLYGAAAIGVDQTEAKRAHALALGAAAAVNGQTEDAAAEVRAWAEGVGVQCVIDTVGSAASVAQALAMLARGGRLVILGYTQERPPLDPRQIAVHELEIIGTRSGGRQCTAEAIRLAADPRWRSIVSDVFPIAAVNAALDHLRTGAALGRIVLSFPK
ncbi:MAG: alcohol dehydrogenase catalytic domain-containing protein [Anaerolineales bacterium]|nr:alcohol dehydrogenase catalytic domain-containing protein [Anaerolineales bacterium]